MKTYETNKIAISRIHSEHRLTNNSFRVWWLVFIMGTFIYNLSYVVMPYFTWTNNFDATFFGFTTFGYLLIGALTIPLWMWIHKKIGTTWLIMVNLLGFSLFQIFFFLIDYTLDSSAEVNNNEGTLQLILIFIKTLSGIFSFYGFREVMLIFYQKDLSTAKYKNESHWFKGVEILIMGISFLFAGLFDFGLRHSILQEFAKTQEDPSQWTILMNGILGIILMFFLFVFIRNTNIFYDEDRTLFEKAINAEDNVFIPTYKNLTFKRIKSGFFLVVMFFIPFAFLEHAPQKAMEWLMTSSDGFGNSIDGLGFTVEPIWLGITIFLYSFLTFSIYVAIGKKLNHAKNYYKLIFPILLFVVLGYVFLTIIFNPNIFVSVSFLNPSNTDIWVLVMIVAVFVFCQILVSISQFIYTLHCKHKHPKRIGQIHFVTSTLSSIFTGIVTLFLTLDHGYLERDAWIIFLIFGIVAIIATSTSLGASYIWKWYSKHIKK